VTSVDKNTVVFKWKTPNPEFIMETLFGISVGLCLENPEAVRQWEMSVIGITRSGPDHLF